MALNGVPNWNECEVDGVIVLELTTYAPVEACRRIQEAAEKVWPDRKVLVLGPDVRVSRDTQLIRIEAKLDELLGNGKETRQYIAGDGDSVGPK